MADSEMAPKFAPFFGMMIFGCQSKEKSMGQLVIWLINTAKQVQEQHMAPPKQASALQE
ncbi:MAG: hypothetical protein Q9212_002278 [Teloschistes hypoglaucus]